MNDFHERLLGPSVEAALRGSPVVVLTGARQTGKSTLARRLRGAARRRYVTLDDLDVLELAQRDPDAVLGGGPVTLDEVQRAPSLLLAIKRAVDRERTKGRFLVTGSANLLRMQRVGESLAGRAIYLRLGAMTESEIAGTPDAGPWTALLGARDLAEAASIVSAREARPVAWRDAASRGGLPPAALDRDAETRARWYGAYVATYLERDLQQLARIDGLTDFRRLLRLAALRTGATVNQSELGRDVGLSQPTVHRYLDLLEVSCLLHRVPPYAANRGKRVVRTPKLYWSDVGLAAYLAGWKPSGRSPSDAALGGALLENLVLVHLLAWRASQVRRPEVLFWRTASGQEVDFVVEAGDRLLPIEVKATRRPGANDVRWLEAFLADHPRAAPFGVLLHEGDEVRPVGRGVLGVPLGRAL